MEHSVARLNELFNTPSAIHMMRGGVLSKEDQAILQKCGFHDRASRDAYRMAAQFERLFQNSVDQIERLAGDGGELASRIEALKKLRTSRTSPADNAKLKSLIDRLTALKSELAAKQKHLQDCADLALRQKLTLQGRQINLSTTRSTRLRRAFVQRKTTLRERAKSETEWTALVDAQSNAIERAHAIEAILTEISTRNLNDPENLDEFTRVQNELNEVRALIFVKVNQFGQVPEGNFEAIPAEELRAMPAARRDEFIRTQNILLDKTLQDMTETRKMRDNLFLKSIAELKLMDAEGRRGPDEGWSEYIRRNMADFAVETVEGVSSLRLAPASDTKDWMREKLGAPSSLGREDPMDLVLDHQLATIGATRAEAYAALLRVVSTPDEAIRNLQSGYRQILKKAPRFLQNHRGMVRDMAVNLALTKNIVDGKDGLVSVLNAARAGELVAGALKTERVIIDVENSELAIYAIMDISKSLPILAQTHETIKSGTAIGKVMGAIPWVGGVAEVVTDAGVGVIQGMTKKAVAMSIPDDSASIVYAVNDLASGNVSTAVGGIVKRELSQRLSQFFVRSFIEASADLSVYKNKFPRGTQWLENSLYWIGKLVYHQILKPIEKTGRSYYTFFSLRKHYPTEGGHSFWGEAAMRLFAVHLTRTATVAGCVLAVVGSAPFVGYIIAGGVVFLLLHHILIQRVWLNNIRYAAYHHQCVAQLDHDRFLKAAQEKVSLYASMDYTYYPDQDVDDPTAKWKTVALPPAA